MFYNSPPQIGGSRGLFGYFHNRRLSAIQIHPFLYQHTAVHFPHSFRPFAFSQLPRRFPQPFHSFVHFQKPFSKKETFCILYISTKTKKIHSFLYLYCSVFFFSSFPSGFLHFPFLFLPVLFYSILFFSILSYSILTYPNLS